jgi:hypothetical protein
MPLPASQEFQDLPYPSMGLRRMFVSLVLPVISPLGPAG